MKFIVFFSLLIISQVVRFSNKISEKLGVKFYIQKLEDKNGWLVLRNTSRVASCMPSVVSWPVLGWQKQDMTVYTIVSSQSPCCGIKS